MKTMQTISKALVLLPLLALLAKPASGADKPNEIKTISRPLAGFTEILFHGTSGPFSIQTRNTIDPSAQWFDMPNAIVTEIEPGIFLGHFPNGKDDFGFYRIVSESNGIEELKGWTVLVRVSAPANGSFFVAGESPVITATILDTYAKGYGRTDFSTLSLYMYGPQDPQKTVTALKLLNASGDRTLPRGVPHHYVDLRTNPDVQVNGTVLTYRLQPVTDEAPGTYTVAVYSRLAKDPLQQIFKFADIQIGTATVESQVVAKRAPDGTAKCASCHEGTISGKTYLHHIDPGSTSPGNWAYDYEPVRTCKACHNNDGYASFRDASAPGGRVSDHIVLRVHGVHMGDHLENAFNIDPVAGNFRDYRHVEYPADPRNCVSCHLNDRWKTEPSRLACGACHDNVWFGPTAQKPAGMEAHVDMPVAQIDNLCKTCHPADTGGAKAIAEAHRIPPPAMDEIEVTLSPPANGTYYVAGEKPVITLVFKNDSGNPIDHTQVTDANFSTAGLYVYGPRKRAVPVLTNAAKNGNSNLNASVTSSKAGPWPINGKTFKIAINGSAPQNVTIVGAAELVTAAEVVASLKPVIQNLNGGATASVSGANVNIRTSVKGDDARIEIYNGDVTSAMGWKRGPNTTLEPDVTVAATSREANDLRGLADPLAYSDPAVTRNVANITYQLDDVAGLAPGTYGIYVYHLPRAGKVAGLAAPTGLGHLMFQVGTATLEKKIATNCSDCHGDTVFHLAEGPIHAAPFDTDYCTACHDYGHTSTGDMFKNQGGTSLNGWSGYGATPIARRVHGVHNGNYLEHPEEIYANATTDTFGHIIFPQDLRNCTKCHAESDTWKEKPSRLACLACHDSDAAKTHGKLNTFMLDPNDPYGPNSIETCVICHGKGSDFSPDKVHRISNPYVPPYQRAERE